MAGACIRSNVWMIDVMQHYLTNDLEATNEELDYLKQLCALKSKPRDIPSKRSGFRKPSMIIDDFLYHGDLGHARNITLLNELNIQHIVNMCESPLEKDILEHFNVLWININDELGADVRQHFERTNSFLEACKEKGEKVLVHCQMGISRSSSIVLAYLIKHHHRNLSEAYEHLVERRRIASPNFGFFLQLIRYERDLHNNKSTDHDRIPIGSLDTVPIQSTDESIVVVQTT